MAQRREANWPFMPWYTQDWFGDPWVQALTYEEQGIYLALLGRMWETDDGTLPDDDATLARLLRLSVKKFRAVRAVLVDGPGAVMHVVDGRLTQKRLQREVAARRHVHETRAAAGKLGGRPRRQEEPHENQMLSDASAVESTPEPTDNQKKAIQQSQTQPQIQSHNPSPAPSRATTDGSPPDVLDAAVSWLADQLGRNDLSPGEWPVVRSQLAAVGGDLARYQRVVQAALAQRPSPDPDPPQSARFFSYAFAALATPHALPPGRAAPPASALREDATKADYQRLAAARQGGNA